MKNYHFSGIAGTGMSALAQAAIHCGHKVSGSDRYNDLGIEVAALSKLKNLEIEILPQDGSAISEDLDGLIVSTAIEKSNPEIQKALELGVPIIHRAELLEKLCVNKTVIAVAGTAGKSTVTGMLGWIFEQLGFDPSVYSGGAILNWSDKSTIGNFKPGHSDIWILEVDESDKSFLRFHPKHAIITNISKDHYELDELHKMFDQFKNQIEDICVLGWDDEIEETENGFIYKDQEIHLSILGHHNKENAWNAIRLCDALGLDLKKASEAISAFKGIERRLEFVGTKNGAKIYDDFAHNPLKIESVWKTVAEKSERIIAYWKPHGFAPLAQMQNEFCETFAKMCRKNDKLFILPVYYVGGTTNQKIDSKMFVEILQKNGVPAEFCESYKDLDEKIANENPDQSTIILGMGARDPELPEFALSLVS